MTTITSYAYINLSDLCADSNIDYNSIAQLPQLSSFISCDYVVLVTVTQLENVLVNNSLYYDLNIPNGIKMININS